MADERDEPRPPDVEIGAAFSARSLRFREVPETEVEITGEGGTASQRENLPDEVEPGVTYRDVRVRWGAAARLREP